LHYMRGYQIFIVRALSWYHVLSAYTKSTHRNLLITTLLHPSRMSLYPHQKPLELSLWKLCELAKKGGLSPFHFLLPRSPKALVSTKHMSETHGGMTTLYERVSTTHHLHIVMVSFIVSICQSTHRNLLIVALVHPCRTSLHHH